MSKTWDEEWEKAGVVNPKRQMKIAGSTGGRFDGSTRVINCFPSERKWLAEWARMMRKNRRVWMACTPFTLEDLRREGARRFG